MKDILEMNLTELKELRKEIDRLIFLNGSMKFVTKPQALNIRIL